MAYGRGRAKTVPDILNRAYIAKRLNRLMGTTKFDAWNVRELPTSEIRALLEAAKGLQVGIEWKEKHSKK